MTKKSNKNNFFDPWSKKLDFFACDGEIFTVGEYLAALDDHRRMILKTIKENKDVKDLVIYFGMDSGYESSCINLEITGSKPWSNAKALDYVENQKRQKEKLEKQERDELKRLKNKYEGKAVLRDEDFSD